MRGLHKKGARKDKNLLLPAESKPIQNEDLGSQEDARHLAPVKSNAQEVQGTSPVHGRAGDVEGETGDGCIHENAKVVPEVSAGDAQRIHAGEDEDGADGEEGAA